jgi:hypothetical protein
MPKFNAGLPVGDHVLNWEFSATSGLFSCDMQSGGCPGTYGMKISVCELECELDTAKKHEGNAVLDQDSSHTFQVNSLATPWLFFVLLLRNVRSSLTLFVLLDPQWRLEVFRIAILAAINVPPQVFLELKIF